MRNVRFSRDGWKVMLVTVTILALILTGMFTLSVRTPAVAKASTPKKSSSAVMLVEQKHYAEDGYQVVEQVFSDGETEKTYFTTSGRKDRFIHYDTDGNWTIEIVYDFSGGEIIRLPDWPNRSTTDESTTISFTGLSEEEPPFDETTNNVVVNTTDAQDVTPMAIANPGGYYDVETNPLLYRVEELPNGEKLYIYARHTLGTLHPNNYLLTYGDFSSYDGTTQKNVALPYRWEDVELHTGVRYRAMTNNAVGEKERNDFGSNQKPGSDLRYRILDLDTQYMQELTGNPYNLVYGRTWLQVTQYNPE